MTKASPDGAVLLSANPITGILTKIAADEQAETWTPIALLNLTRATGRGPVCVIFRSDGERAYASLFGPAGGIAIVDVPTMTLVGTLPTAGSVSGCGLVNSNDGRTIFLHSAGSGGHFYRLDTWSDTLIEDTSYGPIGVDLHGLAVTASEKTVYITARGVADEIKMLNLNGSDVSTILIDPKPGIADRPDSMARKGSNLYDTVRYSGQVARIKPRRVGWITSMLHRLPQPVMPFTGSPFDLDRRESFRLSECARDCEVRNSGSGRTVALSILRGPRIEPNSPTRRSTAATGSSGLRC